MRRGIHASISGTRMILSSAQRDRLIGAIETDSMIFLCGAGLSIPAPSNLMSAVEVSRHCYDEWNPVESLPSPLRESINRLAGHFHARTIFNVFLGLVPWNALVGAPNQGHAAIGDFLVTKAAVAALSANFDTLIERWAEEHKVALRGALDGVEAAAFAVATSPLIKFHGCMTRERDNTVWTDGQLVTRPIVDRVASCKQWINLHLPGKHLVVVGFWSDWGYLNEALADAFQLTSAQSVTVVDTDSNLALQGKAPTLWAKLNAMSGVFEHVQASSAEVLDELRAEFSRVWTRRYYSLGAKVASGTGVVSVAAPFDTLSMNELYNVRRDAEGVPYNSAATRKRPPVSSTMAALTNVLLLNAGGTIAGGWVQFGGRSIRVVNGSGQPLADVRNRYKEPTTLLQPDLVVCAGAEDLAVPARVVPAGHGASIVRPAPGTGPEWLTLDQARSLLSI
jgi:hypothetical protein